MKERGLRILSALLALILLPVFNVACSMSGETERSRRERDLGRSGNIKSDSSKGQGEERAEKTEQSETAEDPGAADEGEDGNFTFELNDEQEPRIEPGWYQMEGSTPGDDPFVELGFSGNYSKVIWQKNKEESALCVYNRDGDQITMDYADIHIEMTILDGQNLRLISEKSPNVSKLGVPPGDPVFTLKKNVYDESFGGLHYGPMAQMLVYKGVLYMNSYLAAEGEPEGEVLATIPAANFADLPPTENMKSNIEEDVALKKGAEEELCVQIGGAWWRFKPLRYGKKAD